MTRICANIFKIYSAEKNILIKYNLYSRFFALIRGQNFLIKSRVRRVCVIPDKKYEK